MVYIKKNIIQFKPKIMILTCDFFIISRPHCVFINAFWKKIMKLI